MGNKKFRESKIPSIARELLAQTKAVLETEDKAFLNPYLVMGKQAIAYQTTQAIMALVFEDLENTGYKIELERGRGYIVYKEAMAAPKIQKAASPGRIEPQGIDPLKEAQALKAKGATFYDFSKKWADVWGISETKVMEIVTTRLEVS
jgi:hypothetical protein